MGSLCQALALRWTDIDFDAGRRLHAEPRDRATKSSAGQRGEQARDPIGDCLLPIAAANGLQGAHQRVALHTAAILADLTFRQSGCRDLNPGPLVPQSRYDHASR